MGRTRLAAASSGPTPAGPRSAVALLVDELLEARGLFEGRQPGRTDAPASPLHDPAATAGGRERGGRADDAADHEGADAAASMLSLPVHGRILGMVVCSLGDLLLDVIVRLDE